MTLEDATLTRRHLDAVLAARAMTLTEPAQCLDITIANLSLLKNDRGKAVRFSILASASGARLPGRCLRWSTVWKRCLLGGDHEEPVQDTRRDEERGQVTWHA